MENGAFVTSEIGKLKKVIVHSPDDGIARISPKRAEELLFDDIVHLPKMREEHDLFIKVLNAFVGKENVLKTQKLLIEALGVSDESKKELVAVVIDYEELPVKYIDQLYALDNVVLANMLITGYLEAEDHIFFDPIPNFIFTRDIAVTVNDHVIVTKAAKSARHRENLLTRFIFWKHPMFKKMNDEGRIINLNVVEDFPPNKKGEVVSIEGGDVMIMDKEHLLIGCSERTTEHAIHSVKDILFKRGVVDNVVQINIPNDRYCMHIDTLFTRISYDYIVCYKPIVFDGQSSNVIVYMKDGSSHHYGSLKEFILAEINPEMKFIFSGNGESPFQEREQWTDGCNLVSLKPGVAITYDRNPHTEKAFEDHGFKVISAIELLEDFESGKTSPEQVQNTIITIPSNELSRARGGSHCMTCPISRESI